jgi:hypothetical protein
MFKKWDQTLLAIRTQTAFVRRQLLEFKCLNLARDRMLSSLSLRVRVRVSVCTHALCGCAELELGNECRIDATV